MGRRGGRRRRELGAKTEIRRKQKHLTRKKKYGESSINVKLWRRRNSVGGVRHCDKRKVR